MEWLKAHYDRAAALGAALFLLLCALFVFFSASGFSERFDGLRHPPPPNNRIPEGKAPEIADARQAVEAPSQWTVSTTSGLFVPEKHFIGPDGQPATLQNTLLHPPVPNEWLEEFGLPITESDVLTQDPDGDGFTNLDEWAARSNPVDKDLHPPYTVKLKLRSFAQEPFPLIFSSSIGDTYAINNTDQSVPTQFLHLGDTVAGTRYRLKTYTEKYELDKYGTTIDISELTLEQVANHDQVTLVKEKPATAPEAVANFLYSWGGTEQSFAVKKDQEFTLRPEDEVRYKLLEVEPEKATIIDTQKPDEKIEIGALRQ